jgi:hypothetical protein
MRKSSSLQFLTVLAAFSTISVFTSAASPVISSSVFNQDKTLQISGQNFGSKSQAAPVLVDHVEFAYENGVKNDFFGSFSDLQLVPKSTIDPGSLYEKPSVGGASGDYLLVSKNRSLRVQDSTAHYYAASHNAFVGWPAAYGGSNTPVDNPQLFVSWWFKIKHDPRYYWEFPIENPSGGFNPKPGNLFSTNMGSYGYVVNYAGTLVAIFEGEPNSNRLKGATITDLTDGGTAVLSSTGYISPGSNKYIRIWENPNGTDGVRISWTQSQVNGLWATAAVTPGIWHHFQVELDTEKDFFKAYLNGQLVGQTVVDYSNSGTYSAVAGKWSPTIGLLGFDGKQYHQEFEIDDIYMDKTLQRVVLSNSSQLSSISLYEVQRPVEWTDTSIKLELNYGSLNKSSPIYVYVFNKDGVANSQGVLLKNTAKAPCFNQITVLDENGQQVAPLPCD